MAKTSRVAEQLDTMRGQLEKERDDIVRVTAPLYRERDKLVAKIQPLEDQLRAVDMQIKEAELPLYDIGNGLAQLARAGGARVLSNSAETAPAPAEETPEKSK